MHTQFYLRLPVLMRALCTSVSLVHQRTLNLEGLEGTFQNLKVQV
jgi:hypothetical protein